MTDTRDWTPKRRGATYCAPACGIGCTWAAFDAATKAAAALAKRLGAEWEPRVWENCGWHYEARTKCGRLNVSPIIDYSKKTKPIISYHAFLSPDDSPGGVWCENGDTAEEAIANTKKAARSVVQRFATLLDIL